MPLLHLPLELRFLIADCVGASELRKSVRYLLVAKRRYSAVLPVYLSQFPLSHLYLASRHGLERLPPTRLSAEQSNLSEGKILVCPPCRPPIQMAQCGSLGPRNGLQRFSLA